MKIALSKPSESGSKRHVVVVCDPGEAFEVRNVLRTEVLPAGMTLESETIRVRGVPKTKFRLAQKWLEPTLLALPFAEVTQGMETMLSRRALEEIQAMRVPDLSAYSGFNGELYDFQAIGVGRMMKRKRFLNLDELGLGKTIQALATIVYLEAFPALVICPNSIKYSAWASAIEQFTDCSYAIVDGTAAQRAEQINKQADITVIHHEGLRVREELSGYKRNPDGSMWKDKYGKKRRERIVTPVHPDLFEIDYELIVVDEYHKFKNPKAQQTRGLHRLHAPRQIAMTGTPVVNGRPEEYWSALHWLWPTVYPDYEQYIAEHCIQQGGKTIGYRNLKKVKEFVEAKGEKTGLPIRSIRRRKEWIGQELPDVVYSHYELDMTKEQRKLYNEIKNDLMLRLDDGEFKNVTSALAQMTRLKQACFSPELYEGSKVSAKLATLKDIVEELVNNGEKAIIFSEWSKACRIIERELAHYNPAYIDGSVKPKDRKVQADIFNNEEDVKVFIGTIGACSTGFSLGVATYVIFTDLDWVPANNVQAVGRSAAGGLRGLNARSSTVNVIELKMKDSVEQKIDAILAKKQAVNSRMTDRDTGAKFEQLKLSDIRDLLA